MPALFALRRNAFLRALRMVREEQISTRPANDKLHPFGPSYFRERVDGRREVG
jgi:hypothetical protein